MKALLLGPTRPVLEEFLKRSTAYAGQTEETLSLGQDILQGVDFLISYGYRHIIPSTVLQLYPKRAINLHISFLPWNRGSEPNLWSFLDNTKKGVTIHYMDDHLDTGDILAQREVSFGEVETLRSSYTKLSETIETLFCDSWPALSQGHLPAQPQRPGGSYHRVSDRKPYEHLLHSGWDTPVAELIGRAAKTAERTIPS